MNRLEAIRARERAATPGPWEDMGGDTEGACVNFYEGSVVSIEYDDTPLMMPTKVTVICRDGEGDDRPEDRAFIAAARDDIPLLLAVAEAAAAIPGWTTLFDLLGKIEVLKAAIAPLMEEVK